MTKQNIFLVYDKQCPACDFYCNIIRIRETVGKLVLIDAREGSDIMEEITARGWDIDQGMVLKVGANLYYGSDAIFQLSLLGSRSTVFNRMNYWLFKSPRRAHMLYPLLRNFRNLLLKLLGKTKINNLNKLNNERF